MARKNQVELEMLMAQKAAILDVKKNEILTELSRLYQAQAIGTELLNRRRGYDSESVLAAQAKEKQKALDITKHENEVLRKSLITNPDIVNFSTKRLYGELSDLAPEEVIETVDEEDDFEAIKKVPIVIYATLSPENFASFRQIEKLEISGASGLSQEESVIPVSIKMPAIARV